MKTLNAAVMSVLWLAYRFHH